MICECDNEICELNYPPPEYDNPNYPREGNCRNCHRYNKEVKRMKLQKEYCKKNKLPFFAPPDGICWVCHGILTDTDKKHITGCELCNKSYCD